MVMCVGERGHSLHTDPGATTRYSSARRGTSFHSGPDAGPVIFHGATFSSVFSKPPLLAAVP